MPVAANAPRCFVCEDEIGPGEPFKIVQAWTRDPGTSRRELAPANAGAPVGLRIVQRGVHYSCELEAIASCVGAATGPELVVEGHEDEDLTTREKLHHLMRGAVELLDALDEVL